MGEINCSKKLKTSEVNVVDATFTGFVVPNGKTLNYVLEYFNSQINGLISSSNPITVKDEGSSLTSNLSSLNFTGPGVTASAVGNEITVNITGGGGSVTGTPNYSARYNSLGLLSTGVIQDDNHRVGVNTAPNSDAMLSVLTTFETYAIQLRDGTQGAGKFLKSITADGEANWANITASDVLGVVAGSGTTNYISKFTPNGTTLGDSQIQDNGTNITIGNTTDIDSLITSSTNTLSNVLFLSNTRNTGTNRGLYSEAIGNGASFNYGFHSYANGANLNIGVNTRAQGTGTSTIIGIKAEAQGTGSKYSAQLQDGTEDIGKFLKSVTSDGRANWSNITVSDVSGAVDGSGTTNYIAKFTSSGTIGNSLIQDNGSTIGIGTNPTPSTKFFISSDVKVSGWFRSNTSNSDYVQGIIGEASGSTNYFNIGVEGRSVSTNVGGSNIGGWFRSASGSSNYSVQLQDGTEGLGKFLKSVTADGRANWTNITTSDISGAIVSSVGLSMPSAFSVSNSPITSSGTISVTGAGTTAQYVRGDGTLATFPTSLPTSNVKHAVKYGVALTIGQAVYVSSADGTNMIVSKADNSSEATSSKTIGLVTSTGAANYQGEVITEGLLAGLDTSTATVGDAVWLGTNGNLIFWHYGGSTTKPVAPAHLVFIGIVTRVNSSNGEIFVKPQNGFEIDELHDVSVVGRANNTLLGYNSSTSLHEFKTIATWLGYTPANKAGDTFTGAISATNLSGTNTGDETTATIKTKLGAASSTADGYLTSIDWSTFNAKQNAITLTTTSSSGSATLVGSTLNIPTYTLAGLGGISLSSLSASTPLSYNSGTGAFSIQVATTAQNGYLSSIDWNTFNGKQSALSGTGFVKISGSTISYDNSTYLTGNQTITLSGDVSGSGTTGISTSISAATVTGKALTGFVSGAGTVSATDSILSAIQKLDGNTSAKVGGSGTTNYVPKFTASGTLGDSNIYSSGTNTGIGVTTPIAPFHVSSVNKTVSSALYTSDFMVLSGEATAPGFNIVAAGDNGGNRGVIKGTKANGTLDAPTVPLTGNSAFSILSALYDGVTNLTTAGVLFEVDGAVSAGVAPQRILFATSTGNSRLERMRITSGGNVGIGVTGPGSKLEVSGDISLYNATDKIGFRYSSVNATLFNYIGNSYGSTTSDGLLYRAGGWTGTQTIVSHNFQTWTGSAWDSKMLIFQNGDVKLSTISNAASSTDKFLVSESGVVKYRTAAQTLADIGAQGTITLTTTGTSGAATLVGNTLNIPQYSGGTATFDYGLSYAMASQNILL